MRSEIGELRNLKLFYALGKATATEPETAESSLNRVTVLDKDAELAASAYLNLAGIHRKKGKADLAAHDMQEFRRIQALKAAAQ